MKRLSSIFSQRKTSPWPSFKIVYEWEDILSEKLGIPVHSDGEIWKKYYRRFDKNGLTWLYHAFLPQKDLRLDFVMTATIQPDCRNNKNTIPVIIDFWLKESEIPDFFKVYRNVPLMLVTNREVYELLNRFNPPFPVEHWALSYPDQYIPETRVEFKKEYDFCLFGRPNPFFERMRDRYAESHPDFTCLVTRGNERDREFYTNKGEFVCKDSGRQSYLEMLRKTRISCYSTPGIDESKKESASFNQVTPRVFEMLCSGCQVIGHYPCNGSDVRWYQLDSIVPSIDTYDEFEKVLETMLSQPADMVTVTDFLNHHKTSTRAVELVRILEKHDISLKTGR